MAASNMPNYSDLAKLVSSSGGLIKRGQPWDSIVYPKNPYTDKNSVIDAFRDKDHSNSRESTNLVMECQTSRCSTSSKFVDSGPDGGLQSIHAYIDSFLKSRDPCITNPAQNSRTYNENYDVSKIKNACDPVIAERVATSSNIELRLGQPYQQSQSSGNSVPLVTEPKLLDTVVAQPRSLFLEQMTNNAAYCGERVALRQKFQCSAGPANLSARNESNLNIGRHVFGISNVTDTTKLDKFDGNVTKTSMVPSLAHVSTAPEMNANSKANNHMVSSDHIIPKSVHCEPYSAKSNPVRVPWTVVDGSERQLNVSELGFFRIEDKGKGVGCTADGSYAKIDSVSNIEKQQESRCTCPVAMGGSKDPCSSVVHDKIYYSHQSSGVPPDAFDARNLFNYPEKVPSLGSSRHTDHLFLTSKGSPWGSSQLLQSQAVSMASPLATSASMQGMAPAIPTVEGTGVSPYLLDDNMRFLALRQILELSKQQQAISSLGMDQETGRTSNFSNVNIRPLVGPSAFGEQTPGPNITSQRDSSAVAMLSPTSSAYTKLGVNIEKSSPIADLNNSCEFSTWICGNPLLSREIDLQCQFPHDPPSNKQLPLRSEHISSSIENAKCYPGVSYAYFQGHCSCTAYSKCLGGNCESRIGNAPNTFKDQVGNVNGVTPTLVASEFVKDGTDLREKIISSDQRAKVTGQVRKSNVCHASQWKDVPSKYKGVSTVACLDLSAEDLLDGRGNIDGQLGDATSKCSYGTMKIRDSLKEQEMSNISSGCSAAAVTHTSVQGNNLDSTTPDVGNARYINKHIVDEGSGIDKCWSSDDALESERSAEFLGSNCKTNLSKEGSSKNINNLSSRSLLDELKLLNSLTWKKNRKQTHTRLAVHGKINFKKIERGVKTGKKKRARKIKMLVPQCPTGGPSTVPYKYPKGTDSLPFSSEDVEMHNPSFQETCISGACSPQPISKCGRSLSSSKELFRKRDLHMIYDDRDGNDYQIEANPCKIHEFSGIKEFGRAWTSDCTRKSQMAEPTHVHTKDGVRCRSFGCMKALSSGEVNICSRKVRPVVCGKYGEICNELIGDVSRPAKIVPLSRILKTSRRDTLPNTCDSKQTFPDELKKTIFCGSDAGYNGFSHLKEEKSAIHHSSICNEMNVDLSLEEDEKMFTNGVDEENSMLEKKLDHKSKKNCSKLNRKVFTKSKPKSKEIRKRSLCELTDNGKKSTSESFSLVKISKCMPKMEAGKVSKNAVGSKQNIRASSEVNSEKLNPEHRSLYVMDSDAFCCVCGGSNKDEINCLIECSRCFIKVHQACYGVSKVPKGHWYCRPCRTNSRDIVCVLCGYGGGAMTCALRSRTIVKGLLKAWNIETDSRHKNAVSSAQIMEDDLNMLHSSGPMLESSMLPVSRPVNTEPLSTAAWKMDFPNQLDVLQKSSGNANNVKVHNSITAGAFDSTVKQWVHMVCGLWTPGTRCPNVDTMSAFDVSGASHPKANVVCSICNRPGGSCIQCRVVNCSVKFHPWCAHQKGLLQSEVEGAENESVGFYGRCVLHATHPLCESGSDPFDIEVVCSIEKEFTCARTEGYKGRKRDGFWHNLHGQSRGKSACLVPQEQLNAWIHINGQKSSTNGLPKLTVSDVEYDCRKEYARYKQMKGWKHLVVYKSGIHALGLYTSRFISRGEMVVEYVGEIVGLRVADKREIEYQSGRKLQYKSACYFFRIDKEHIIDATCKGGIARFVNHSCLPNCVAKVISVRNEKKVVFFAERDIYPGEEITYDYHFNHEDEGKKIPCFCNSKNCRRYLN